MLGVHIEILIYTAGQNWLCSKYLLTFYHVVKYTVLRALHTCIAMFIKSVCKPLFESLHSFKQHLQVFLSPRPYRLPSCHSTDNRSVVCVNLRQWSRLLAYCISVDKRRSKLYPMHDNSSLPVKFVIHFSYAQYSIHRTLPPLKDGFKFSAALHYHASFPEIAYICRGPAFGSSKLIIFLLYFFNYKPSWV